ncbi:FecR domain-containing protein [Maribacter polysiphoniae]|uniref:FecR domain-containing protein n=1 Tax=Maribacter polysiphoniae TaxID=429344 RepID=UPI0023549ECA|nr:FecR domain-containing protein [Maribacter polysiphoniae]
MQEDLLHKYLENQLSPEEKKIVLRWIKENKEHQKTFNILKAKHVAKTLKNVSDSGYISSYLIFKKKRSRKKITKYLSYAAVGILLISLGFFYSKEWQIGFPGWDSQIITVQSVNGTKKKVILPDGSTAILNIESYLKFPKEFNNETRKVTLVGEAIFDIVHDSLHPFIVQTAYYDVKVLGTTFNVKSYPNDTQTETTLITGKVELLRENKKPIVLSPSQQAVFQKEENRIKTGKVISKDVVAWQKGTLVFNNTPMQQVALDLERNHNKKIIIKSSKLLKYEYTGTLDNLTLEESLQLLKVSSPIDYEILKNEIILKMKE